MTWAKGFQLPTQPVRAIRYIVRRLNISAKQYDLGEFQLKGKKSGHYFIKSLGIGLYAEVIKVTEELPLKKLMSMLKIGYVTFINTLIKVLLHYQPSTLEISVNGKPSTYNNVWFSTTSISILLESV